MSEKTKLTNSKDLHPRKASPRNVIHEFLEVYHIEQDLFKPLIKCRENIYKLDGIEGFVLENPFVKEVEWNNYVLKNKGLWAKFNSLERRMGFIDNETDVMSQQTIYDEHINDFELKDVCIAIYDYLVLNVEIEEQIEKMLTRANAEYAEKLNGLGNLLDMNSPEKSAEFMKFGSFYSSIFVKSIKNISVDSNKYITYQIKAKENLKTLGVQTMFKLKDRTYNIKQLYERMVHNEESLYNLLGCLANIEQKEKISQLNNRLYWLTGISAAMVILQTIIAIVK